MTIQYLITQLKQDVDSILSNYIFTLNTTLNTTVQRQQITNQVANYLDSLKLQRSIRDYRVICDASNNLPGSNDLKIDVLVQPTLSVNHIQLSAVVGCTTDDDYIFQPPERLNDDNTRG